MDSLTNTLDQLRIDGDNSEATARTINHTDTTENSEIRYLIPHRLGSTLTYTQTTLSQIQESPDNSQNNAAWVAPFRFLDLPQKIRHKIYKYLPETTYAQVFLGGRYGTPTKIQLPAITRAGDTLIRQEAIKITIEITTFSVHSFEGNQKFTEWLGIVDLSKSSKNYISGFDAVKSLEFPYFSRFPHRYFDASRTNSDIELMVRCKNLEKASLTWASDELFEYDDDNGSMEPKSVEVLRRQYRLDRMLACENLTTVLLVGYRSRAQSLQDLADWLRAELPAAKNGRGVDVRVC
jgi:hypothetical protein